MMKMPLKFYMQKNNAARKAAKQVRTYDDCAADPNSESSCEEVDMSGLAREARIC